MMCSIQFAPRHRRNVFEFDAIGTHWWLENLVGDGFDEATKAIIWEHVQMFDTHYSRFKDDSLIGVLNTKKYLARPPQKLLDMLALCHELYSVSDGAFDITVGGVLHSQGYGGRQHASRVVPNFWNEAVYNRDEIRTPDQSVIDTGGYGKGWLIDELIEILAENGYHNVIVNGGGDLRIANRDEVEFALEHPYDSSKKVGMTRLANGALAVSGAAKRLWGNAGKQHTHIVDPRTSDSLVTTVAATYVQASTARAADSIATAVFIRPDLKQTLQETYDAKIVVLYNDQLATA